MLLLCFAFWNSQTCFREIISVAVYEAIRNPTPIRILARRTYDWLVMLARSQLITDLYCTFGHGLLPTCTFGQTTHSLAAPDIFQLAKL
jgi:hypothetical protein